MPRDRKTVRKSTGKAAPCKKMCVEEVPKEQEIAPAGVQSEQASHAPPQAVSPPNVGWTKEKYTKLGNNVSESHTRLMGLLQAYYSDMETAVEYFYEENKHPLEDTYWKSRVCISHLGWS